MRVIEGGPSIVEIRISPGIFDWHEDDNGNRYRTWITDENAALGDWLTDNANSGSDSKWNMRQNLGYYGPILESFPGDLTEDCPPLKTSVQIAEGGTYQVALFAGDTGQATDAENHELPHPLIAGFEGGEMKTYYAWDGVYAGLYGYNIYEMDMGTITVESGETVSVIIDDAPNDPLTVTSTRAVYSGLRLNKVDTPIQDWAVY